MRWKERGRRGGREGGNGVTLTEPVVDKTLRQIRESRVWSLFCFPLLLLSGGISLLLLSDVPSLLLCPLSAVFFTLSHQTFLLHRPSCVCPNANIPAVIVHVRFDTLWIEAPFLLWLPHCVFVFSCRVLEREGQALIDRRREFLTLTKCSLAVFLLLFPSHHALHLLTAF